MFSLWFRNISLGRLHSKEICSILTHYLIMVSLCLSSLLWHGIFLLFPFPPPSKHLFFQFILQQDEMLGREKFPWICEMYKISFGSFLYFFFFLNGMSHFIEKKNIFSFFLTPRYKLHNFLIKVERKKESKSRLKYYSTNKLSSK